MTQSRRIAVTRGAFYDQSVDSIQRDLRSYYEEEARRRTRKPLKGRRVTLRGEFLELLRTEQRRSVLDFGAGPASDGQAFAQAGHRYLGLDLAHGNGVLAAAQELQVVQASIGAPPIRSASFEAGWSMSTLMHIPTDEVPGVLAAMMGALQGGAPLVIGLWGGDNQDLVNEDDLDGERRLFSLRTAQVNESLLAEHGTVERAETWDVGSDVEHYQVFWMRTPGSRHRS